MDPTFYVYERRYEVIGEDGRPTINSYIQKQRKVTSPAKLKKEEDYQKIKQLFATKYLEDRGNIMFRYKDYYPLSNSVRRLSPTTINRLLDDVIGNIADYTPSSVGEIGQI